MNLGSCHAPAWVPSNPPPNSAWAATMRIRGQLCRLCDLALEVRDGGKLPRPRHNELRILRTLHGDFERLDLNTVHGISAAECDVCCLARAAKRMVLSEYAGEWTDFIRATHGTKDGTAARVNRDFADDFRRYIERSGLPEQSRAYQLMVRAELVSQYLTTAERAPESPTVAEEQAAGCRVEDALSSPTGEYIQSMTDQLRSLHVRIMTRGGAQLRIVR